MIRKTCITAALLAAMLIVACAPDSGMSSGKNEDQSQGAVEVGDSLADVQKTLGEPNIEFPDGDRMIHWFAGYEVTTSNNVVVAVQKTQAESI